MATKLKDISERANVSTAAVSLALNGKAGVSKETAQRILKIARELNYSIPQDKLERFRSIRFIRIERSECIMDPVYDLFISEYLAGLARAVKASGYRLEVSAFAEGGVEEAIDAIADDCPAGVVVLGAGLMPEDVRRFVDLAVPVVFIDVCYDFIPLDFVDMNNVDSVYRIVAYLRELGHSKIGFVGSSLWTPNIEMREEAFFRALESFGLVLDPEQRFVLPEEKDLAASAMAEALAGRRSLPTALFCVNDTVAYSAVQGLRARSLRVPEDVSVVGFDDLPASEFMEPPLTTIHVSKELVGERAFYLLSERIRLGPGKPAEKLHINGSLVIRRSVSFPRA